MILLIVYLVGCFVVSLMLSKFIFDKGEFLVNDLFAIMFVSLFSWISVVLIICVLWFDRIKNIVLWKRKQEGFIMKIKDKYDVLFEVRTGSHLYGTNTKFYSDVI